MAGDGEEDNEYYQSDPEEAKMSLNMRRRRREASDDEEEAIDDITHHHHTPPMVDVIPSDVDSDGQGGAAEYDDGEGDEEDSEEYYEDEREEELELEVEGFEVVNGGEEERGLEKAGEVEEKGEKKENEPFSVPTLGAFYMHDDRFRDNAGARQRKTFGGRRLWESKDDRKWGHDKFEEMNMQERPHEEGRKSSRGYYRGHGKGRGAGRGNVMGHRMRGYDGNNNQNLAPKEVRGRGPRRYQPSMKSKSETLPPQNRRTSHAGFGRNAASSASNIAEDEAAPIPAIKVASNLNYASRPFYPSGSSTLVQKTDVPVGNHNKNPRSTVVEQNFSGLLSNPMFRGKSVMDSMGMDKLRIDDSVSPAIAKSANNVHLPFSESSSLSTAQMSQTGAQGRGVALPGSTMLQPPRSHSQVNKVSPSVSQAPQRNTAQYQAQASLQASGQHLGHHSIGASQGSPPKGGKGTVQGAGMGALMYSGAQVMESGGNTSAGNGDQNLPAFFPVMQLGAQHPRGIGVPAVGMAFPGYVAQPNGAGNSEMTWLPVLASAAGALGATYCPPYLPVDGTYHSRPTGQTSALPAPSKDINHSRLNNEVKPRQRSEFSNDDFSQRQNKPRRYSEMNITQ